MLLHFANELVVRSFAMVVQLMVEDLSLIHIYRGPPMMYVNSQLLFILMRRLRWGWICLLLLVVPVYGQSDLNLEGAIDFQVHSSPDSAPRSIDADDLARLAKEEGMRGLVLKNHFESTAALAYMVRKEVPGTEIFGGIALNRAVGGINLEAVKRMTMMKGGWGRVVWLPTIDSENFAKQQKHTGPFVPVVKSGHLVAEVLGLIDYVAPVSYTHLDVYKRQLLHPAKQQETRPSLSKASGN